MIEFDRHSECRECPLWEAAVSPGLPTRALFDDQGITKTRALLFLGQSPGYREDAAGKSFVGYTGGLLKQFIGAAKLTDYADIYLANSCRCLPPQGANETQSNIRKCRAHLLKDIDILRKNYEEVIIVALGAKACYSAANIKKLTDGFKKQGVITPLVDGQQLRVFFTYHPALLHPSRQPAKVYAVQAHFNLLLRYLQGDFIPNDLIVKPVVNAPVPETYSYKVSVDIETYGILAGREQTVFNPHKSKYVDGVDYPKQIITVSFAWRDKDDILQTAVYQWDKSSHRKTIQQWFRSICGGDHILVGANIKFDLMYLRMGDKELQYWIQSNRLFVNDTLLSGFLLNEQQPEKGLKELSVLHGIASYDECKVTGKDGNAKSSSDKDLHYYNALDAASALILSDDLEKLIEKKYGSDSPKLSKECKKMCNVVIWDTLDLDLNGSTLDIGKLEKFHVETEERCKEIMEICETGYEIKLAGPGSDAPLRQFVGDCLGKAGLYADRRVQWTKKDGKVAIGVENVNLAMKHLPECREQEILALFQEYKRKSKIVSTYTLPLLTDNRRGIVLRDGKRGLVYPDWYPIPMYYDKGGSSEDKQGGQIQGRFSCKKPARQTEPKSIRRCSTSRWADGKLAEYDVNQDHIRMAALLSGDPFLMEAYENPSESIHTRTARVICPDVVPESFASKDEWKDTKEYKLGKTLNFLVLFGGGARAFQATALEDAEVEVELKFCEEAIRRWYQKYHVYKNWQDRMVALATKQGYLVLPTGWSRTFGPPGTNLSAFKGEILNFMHQTPCAQLLQSCHFEAINRFRKYKLHSLVCLQIYDALFVDTYPGEEKNVDEIIDSVMIRPPLLSVFEKQCGRSIPWAYEKKGYDNENTTD